MKCQFKGTPINEALVRDFAGRSWKRQDPSRHCHRPQLHPRLEAESRNARQGRIADYLVRLTTGEKLIKNHRFEIIEAAS